jgi:hypothetical protein
MIYICTFSGFELVQNYILLIGTEKNDGVVRRKPFENNFASNPWYFSSYSLFSILFFCIEVGGIAIFEVCP